MHEHYFRITAVGDEATMQQLARTRGGYLMKVTKLMIPIDFVIIVTLWFLLPGMTDLDQTQVMAVLVAAAVFTLSGSFIATRMISKNLPIVRRVSAVTHSQETGEVAAYELDALHQGAKAASTKDRALPHRIFSDPTGEGDFVVVVPARTLRPHPV